MGDIFWATQGFEPKGPPELIHLSIVLSTEPSYQQEELVSC